MQEPGALRDQNSFELASFFPLGTVIKQEDEAPHRVQVRIAQFHTGIPDEDLPFFRIAFSPGQNGHNGRSGKFATLAHGTEVVVLLYDKRGYNGLVVFEVPNTSNDIQGENLYGYRDELGNEFAVDKEGGMTMTDTAGAKVAMKAGVISIDASELHLKIGDMTITGEMLTTLVTDQHHNAQTWALSAATPTITDGAAGGGASGSGPTLTPPQLPNAPDFHGKEDI